ncbi:hypothetical protein EGW08_016814, partial [Elysia chlorotica]
MSRRKQARPKSCKTEEADNSHDIVGLSEEIVQDDENPEGMEEGSSMEASTLEMLNGSVFSSEEVQENIPEDDTVTPSATMKHPETNPFFAGVVDCADAKESKMMRCERCNAVFTSLVQFMDHRNFECGSGN